MREIKVNAPDTDYIVCLNSWHRFAFGPTSGILNAVGFLNSFVTLHRTVSPLCTARVFPIRFQMPSQLLSP